MWTFSFSSGVSVGFLFNPTDPMIAKLTMLSLAFFASIAHAQISVTIKADRHTYLVNEPVTAVVSITNRSGRELFFHSEVAGRTTKSWLDFDMRESGGSNFTRLSKGVFRAAKLPPGQTITRRVTLSSLYRINRPGNFSTNAKITIDGRTYKSTTAHFTVSSGSEVFTQPFGAPGTKYPEREYRVLTFNDGRHTSIYTAVHDQKTQSALSTSRLSHALLFKRPQAALDGKNNLHVLYQSTPEIFVHATVNKDGAMTASKFFKRGASGIPSLMAFADGSIKARGGIPYDPSAEMKKRAKAKTISERVNR